MNKYRLPLYVFLFVSFILSMIQWKVQSPMLLLERFFDGGGWIEILIVALWGATVAYKMQDPTLTAKWRRISWMVFSVWFFTQLFLGIAVSEIFLLTGKLHIPVPAMIISGPIYRGQKSIMTLLFLSTIVLTGPAWCSQLCYFGAIDNMFAKGKTSRKKIKHLMVYKHSVLFFVIAGTLLFRLFNIKPFIAAVSGIAFGVAGLAIILFLSRKQKRMIHCTAYCPIGTLVNYLKFLNPFRLYIDNTCDLCMACTSKCKYNALNIENIKKHKPAITCTLCGDCISTCKNKSIQYRFFKTKPDTARNIYLFLTISLYAVFIAMGRI